MVSSGKSEKLVYRKENAYCSGEVVRQAYVFPRFRNIAVLVSVSAPTLGSYRGMPVNPL